MKKCCIVSRTPDSWREFEGSDRYDLWTDDMLSFVNSLYKEGVTNFISSLNLGAETVFAEAVLRLKESKNNISLECALPFEEQAKNFLEPERDRYFKIIENSNLETLVSKSYTHKAEENCYKYMISRSDVIIISEEMKNELSPIITDCRNINKRYIYI